MTAMGIAQVPGRDLRKVDTEEWPVLGQDTDPAAINAEVRELIERINAKLAAGELSERDQELLRELVEVDGWERAHLNQATAAYMLHAALCPHCTPALSTTWCDADCHTGRALWRQWAAVAQDPCARNTPHHQRRTP